MSSPNIPTSFGAQPADTPLAQLQAVLGAGGAGGGGANPDQAMIFNLASAIAMNSLLAMNQQQGSNPPALANAAKLWLGMNLMNPQANLLNLAGVTGQQQQQQQQPVNPLNFLPSSHNLPASTAAVFPSHHSPSIDSRAANHMSLKRSAERNDRKRSLPATQHEFGKKAQPQSPEPRKTSATKPPSSHDIENCLNRILKEEIYNIFEGEDIKEEPSSDLPSVVATEEDSKSSVGSSSSGGLAADMTLLELIDYVTGDSPLGNVQSAGSAFRKVSGRGMDGQMRRSASQEQLVRWGVSISPPDSSPTSEGDLPPLTPDTLALIREVALSTRESTEDIPLSRSAQLEKTPTVWRGQVQMKTNEATVQLHLISGQRDFVSLCLGPLVQLNSEDKPKMRINQRMRTESQQLSNVLTKLQVCGAACLCVPIGVSKEDASRNNQNLKTHFLEYFTNKGAAGIASMPATETSPASLVYIFPPSEFTDTFMSQYSVQLYQRIKHNAGLGYLFVVVLPADDAAAP